ncbi:MAG: GntR family transcriptional regulator [Gemmatales bacterium]
MSKAVDVAYAAIRDGILSGDFPQGSHITAQQLAEATGLSRTPVREAMRRLHAEGLIRFIPNRGAFVSSWTEDEIAQTYELRVLLESFAAKEAAAAITDDQLEELRRLAVEMREMAMADQPDVGAIAQVNDQFHKAVLEAAGNARLRDLLNAIVEVPLVLNTFRRYTSVELRRSASQHMELVEAFEAHDAEWAQSVMTAHIRSARHTLMSSVGQPGSGLFAGVGTRVAVNDGDAGEGRESARKARKAPVKAARRS